MKFTYKTVHYKKLNRIFYKLYDLEIIEETSFIKWFDENDDKKIIVAQFINWLETAEEESE